MNKPLNIPMLVGLAIPLVMVIVVMLAIYVPSRYVDPKYDFLYVVGSPYESPFFYVVREGKIVIQNTPLATTNGPIAIPMKPDIPSIPILYRHDVKTNLSSMITLEEAQQLKLDSKRKSPDGYAIAQSSGGGVFPFFYEGSHDNDQYIKNQYGSQKLNVEGAYNFQFLAWVIPSN